MIVAMIVAVHVVVCVVSTRRERPHRGGARGDQRGESVDQEPDQRKKNDEAEERGLERPATSGRLHRFLDPNEDDGHHQRSRLKFRTSTDSAWRKTDRMIASPTAASAAATAMTKNTTICPSIPA